MNRKVQQEKVMSTLSAAERRIKMRVAKNILSAFLKSNVAFKSGLTKEDL